MGLKDFFIETPERKAARLEKARRLRESGKADWQQAKADWQSTKADLQKAKDGFGQVQNQARFKMSLVDGVLTHFEGFRKTTKPVTGVTATVDVSGAVNRRITATRAGAGFVLAGPIGALVGAAARKKQDDREMFLLVEGPDFAWVEPVAAKHHAAARQFAAQINTAARGAA